MVNSVGNLAGKLRPCTMEDASSATGFRGQFGDVAFPGNIMTDSEAQNLNEKASSRGLLRK